MAIPRFFALIVGLLAAAYFGFGLARHLMNPISSAAMLLGAAILLIASARRPKNMFQRKLIAGAWGAFSIICIVALGLMVGLGGGGREKAMALLLFVTAIAFTVRAAWQAGRKRRHKWDNYFDK